MEQDQNDRRVISWETQLFHAVDIKAPAQAERVLSRRKVSPDCKGEKGQTPLIKACAVGDAAMAAVLLRYNANVNAMDDIGYTPLMAASFNGHIDVVKILVSNGADLTIRNQENLTASEAAEEMGFPEIATYLSAQEAASSTRNETSEAPDDDGPTSGPSGASLPVAAAMAASPEPRSYVQELDLEAIPELEKSPFSKVQHESEIVTGDGEEEPTMPPQEDEAESAGDLAGKGDQSENVWRNIQRQHEDLSGGETRKAPPVPGKFPGLDEERIEFDALDNKQVRNINEKIKKVLDKAGFEVGDFVIDTVFKGGYMAVLKPRSQENKRWRKLKKHPDWLIDPRRLTELIGGCAARRLCLAEGIDALWFSLSHFIELYYAKDVKLILTLAEEASDNKYTVRQLKKAVDDLREHKDDHDPGKEIIRTLDQPVPILEDPDLMALCMDENRVLKELSETQRKRIRVLLKARKPALDESKKLMDTLERILSDLAEG
jgi:hypothetical protein